MIKVSVVMPCLNAREFLKECLESVLHQTLKEIEVIIVDAGSTDGTLEILAEYTKKDDRIRVLHSDKKSMGYQYNMGIDSAQGKYVGFVEMDDYIDREMYETLFRWAEENQLDYVKSDFKMFFEKEGERIFLPFYLIPLHRNILIGKVITVKTWKEILCSDLNMWNGIYRRDFLLQEQIRLNETKGAAFQDMDFVLQVNMLGRRAMYERKNFYYYRRDNAASSTYNPRTICYVLDELKFILAFMERHPELNDFRPFLCRRFANSFFSKYQPLLKKEIIPGEVYEKIREFQIYLKKEWRKETQQGLLKAGMWYHLDLRIFMQSLELYEAYTREKLLMQESSIHAFIEEVKNLPELVLMGCGERGRSLYTLMKKKDVNGSIIFADNNDGLWGKEHMGCKIYSPEDAVKKFPNAVYIITMADESIKWKIKCQLVELHIAEEQIYLGIYISPHQVTDIGD